MHAALSEISGRFAHATLLEHLKKSVRTIAKTTPAKRTCLCSRSGTFSFPLALLAHEARSFSQGDRGRGPKIRETNKPCSRSMLVTVGVTFQLSAGRNVGSRAEAVFFFPLALLAHGARETFPKEAQDADPRTAHLVRPGIPQIWRYVLEHCMAVAGSTLTYVLFCLFSFSLLSSSSLFLFACRYLGTIFTTGCPLLSMYLYHLHSDRRGVVHR